MLKSRLRQELHRRNELIIEPGQSADQWSCDLSKKEKNHPEMKSFW